MKKTFIIIMSVLLTGTKIAATEWTTYICYHEDIMYSMVGNQTYLRPVAYYECLSFSLETQAYSIMNRLIEYNSVFDYEKLENKEGGNLQVYLKAKMLSDVECQALIVTMLMHGFDYVTIVYAGGKQHKYSKKDINIPFFLPVYFDDQSSSNDRFIQNACEMIQLAYEEDVRNWGDEHLAKPCIFTGVTDKKMKSLNTVFYFLFAISFLLNVLFVWKLKQKA